MGLVFQRAFWRLMWFPFAIVLFPLVRLTSTGRDCIPSRGAALVLANHVNFLDPFYMGLLVFRAMSYMASAHWFGSPVLGPLLVAVGAFPKMKFTRDLGALTVVNRLWEQGALLGIYPEGRRSWDGRQLPIRPNIGKLIKRLDAPVVYCRNTNGHIHEPRWAVYPRWAPVHMEFEGPVRYPADLDHTEIAEDVSRRLLIHPETVPAPKRWWGFRMAEGLPGYLWACPHCLVPEGIRVVRSNRHQVRCRECGSTWEVGITQELRSITGPGQDTSVYRASDRIEAHFGSPPRIEGLAEGVVLEDTGDLLQVGRFNRTTPVCRGATIQLTADDVRAVLDGEVRWRLGLGDLLAASIEGGDHLQLRSAQGLVRVELADDASPYKWQSFLLAWRGQLTGRVTP